MTKILTPLGVFVMVYIPLALIAAGIAWLVFGWYDNLEKFLKALTQPNNPE